MKYLSFVICIFLGSVAAASDLPKLYAVIGVAANDALNIRAEPNADADVLGGFVHNATGVEVVALSPDGKWGQVNIGEQAGWSAMRFLTPMPADEPLWMSCFGVEPSWGVILDEAGNTSEWASQDGRGKITDLTPQMTTADMPRKLAFAGKIAGQGDFQTLITYQSCSDGMADNQYGLSVDLTLSSGRQMSGCCTLQN